MERGALLLLLLGFGTTSMAAEPCLTYEPSVVMLSGTVAVKVFPGPPNFESVENGDRAERTFVLQLVHSICISGRDSLNNGPVGNIREIQLVLPSTSTSQFVPLAQIRVKGKLFGRHSGHHKTSVIMEVLDFEQAT